MTTFFNALIVVSVGACLGFGFRWGLWIWDGCKQILQDLRSLLRRKS